MNIPLVNDDPVRINSSITYLRNNCLSQLNEDFDVSSINVLYAGVEALVSSLRDICSRYGVNIKATTSGALIKSHSNKFKALNVKDVDSIEHFNVFFDDIQNQLYNFDLEVSNLANTSSRALATLAQASYGYSDDDSGGGSDDDEFQRFLTQQQAAATQALAGLDSDIVQEVVEEAADSAEAEREELEDNAKETGSEYTPPTEAEIDEAKDHVNQTWEDAQTAREEAENEAYIAWQEAYREAQEAIQDSQDSYAKATDLYNKAEAAAEEADKAGTDLLGMAGLLAEGADGQNTWANGGTIQHTDTYGFTTTVTVTINDDGTKTVSTTVQTPFGETDVSTKTYDGNQSVSEAATKAQTDKQDADAKYEQAAKDFQEQNEKTAELDKEAGEKVEYANELKEAYDEITADNDDNTTTITVTDDEGNPVSVTFTEDDGSEEGDSLW